MAYQPKHSPEAYLRFIKGNIGCLEIQKHDLSANQRHPYTLFTIPSQHVQGDSLEHLIDKAIDKIREEEER